MPVLVPAELPADAYQTSRCRPNCSPPDKQRVLATAVTPVRTLPVKLPVAVKLDDAASSRRSSTPKTGATVEVKGKVERLNGFAGDVAVTLTGLPAGVPAPAPVTVKAGDDRRSRSSSTLPPTTPAGEIED